ncbi:hypothetical protein FE257_012406 [Aspergillus nanangensis]|uniref:NAD-dependent epimerase/dehydratase domain-containing protein n=1 Tax=Aspergillus nanangensis TaxID=2582783 RepID=A0AAD4CUL1_ASPNN|nr:hypothetical protein FE257_012406 [Aspergillus nanangensis]
MTQQKILLAGATGYVGGTVLNTLLNTNDATIKKSPISVLVRGEESARLYEAKGLRTVQFKDDVAVTNAARDHDVVINAASGFDAEFATALIRGLGQRKHDGGKTVHYIHTSGTTNYADSPILNLYPNHEFGVFSDMCPQHIVSTLKQLNQAVPYQQRSTDLAVLAAGKEASVQTHTVCLPMIYGIGTGEGNKLTRQVPCLMQAAVKEGQAWIVGDGHGIKKHIHVEDAARLYELILSRVLRGLAVPFGEEGVIFVESGEHSWSQVGKAIAATGKKLGVLQTDEVKSLGLKEATEKLGGGDEKYIELAFVSSARSSADVARSLGWKPVHTEESFWGSFEQQWQVALQDLVK